MRLQWIAVRMKRKKLIDIWIPIGSKKKIKCPGDDCPIHKKKYTYNKMNE